MRIQSIGINRLLAADTLSPSIKRIKKMVSFLRGRLGFAKRSRGLRGMVPAISALMCIACLVIPMVSGDQTNKFNPSGDDLTLHSVGGWGLNKTDQDPAIKPGDDFYMSQNGSWFNRTTFT